MKTGKTVKSMIFVLFAGVMLFTSASVMAGKDDSSAQKQKKMYIKNLTGEGGVKKQLLERIRGKMLSTIMDIGGDEYNILDDDTVRVMYDQAEKIMSSGCNDESCINQIAEGINADVIIHGEVSVEAGNITISVQRVDRNKKTLEMSIVSRVNQTFKESQTDWFAEETAKQLMNPRYKIDVSKAPAEFNSNVDIKTIKISGSEDFNVEVLQFETDDTTVQQLLDIAKKHIKEGDGYFSKKEYEDAIDKYDLVIEKIDKKLTEENRKKVKTFREEVVKRGDTACAMMYKTEMENIDAKLKSETEADESFLNKIIGRYKDLVKVMKKKIPPEYYGENTRKLETAINDRADSCCVAICGLHEKLGDAACGDYSFDKGYDEYGKALAVAYKIKGEIKSSIEARYSAKIEATQKTGENYLAFKVKSYTDRAQIYNFDDKTSDAKSMLKQARKYMTGGMMKFVTLAAVEKYNAMAKVLDVDQISNNSEPELYTQIQEEIKKEKEAEQQRLQAEEEKKQQQYIADLKKKGDYKTGKTATFGDIEFVLITDATFTMGSPESETDRASDEKQHRVTVSPFWIGRYEVTQKEYEDVMGTNPASFKGDNLPVESVSWYDAIEFCNKLSEKQGLKPYYIIDKNRKDQNNKSDKDDIKWTVTIAGGNGFRLPTEAEWEYACRAGTTTAYYWGNEVNGGYAWYDDHQTHPVGEKKPNAFGLYDMSGNVWEWCWDWYGEYGSDVIDPKGAGGGDYRVSRGGSWLDYGSYLRSAYRRHYNPNFRNGNIGFRLVRSAQ